MGGFSFQNALCLAQTQAYHQFTQEQYVLEFGRARKFHTNSTTRQVTTLHEQPHRSPTSNTSCCSVKISARWARRGVSDLTLLAESWNFMSRTYDSCTLTCGRDCVKPATGPLAAAVLDTKATRYKCESHAMWQCYF